MPDLTRQSILLNRWVRGSRPRMACVPSMSRQIACEIRNARSSAAPRRQCRSRRDPAQRAGRRAAGSGARRAGRDRGRRRRHHRASAGGPPPHPRQRHGPAEGRDIEAAEFRDGGDRRHAADFARHQAPRGVPGAGAARGAHHRGRAGRGRPAQCAGALHRAAERCRHPGVAVHLGRSRSRSRWRQDCARR